MATSTSKHVFEFLGKSDSLTRASKDVQKELGATEKAMSHVGTVAKAALAGVTVAAIGKFVTSSINAAKEAEVAQNRLEAVFKATGETTTQAAEDAAAYAGELSLLIGVDDELIMSAQAVLATFKDVSSEAARGAGVFDDATAAAADLAAAGFGSIESNAKLLGKALQDPIKGMSQLRRVGVTLTEQQQASITTMVEQNDTLGAQQVILDALKGQVGGTAEATATSFDKIAVAVDEVQEKFGQALMPIVEDVVGLFEAALPFFEDFAAGIGVIVDAISGVEGGVAQAAAAVPVLAGALALLYANPVLAGLAAVATAIALIGSAAANEKRNVEALRAEIEELGEVTPGTVAELIDPDAITAAQELGISIGEITDAVTASDPEYQTWRSNLSDIVGESADLYAQGRLLERHISNLRQDFKDANVAIRDQGDAYRQTASDERNTIDNVAELTRRREEATAATEAETDAVKKNAEEKRKAIDPVFAYRDAIRDQRDAEREAKAALDEFGEDSPQYKKALDDLASAHLDVAVAAEDMRNVDLEPYRQELIKAGIRSGLTREQSREMADGIIDDLERVNEKTLDDKSFTVTTYYREVGQPPANVKAKGGPVHAGEIALVGEEGPEIVRFGASGTVIPNNKIPVVGPDATLPAAAATAGSVSELHIHLHGNLYGFDSFEDAVTRAFERMGLRGRTHTFMQPLRRSS